MTLVRVVVVGVWAVAVGVLGWRSLGWPLIHDGPIMHYIAWRISQGAAPYRDIFDMNFPGTYVLHMAVLWVLGGGDGAWRVFDLGWLVAGALAVWALARSWGVMAAACGALFFALHHLAAGPWQSGQRDFLLCPLLLLGTLAVARWLERLGGAGTLTLGGLALGAGITVKPHALLLAAALGAVVLIGTWRTGVWTPAVAYLVGVAVPPLVVVLWVAALGAGPAWRSTVFDYLIPLYSRVGRPERWGFYRGSAWLPIAAAVVLSLGSALAHRRFSARHALVGLGLGYGVVHYVGQAKGWEYHVYPLAAFAAVLLGSEVEPLLRARQVLIAGPLVTCLLVGVAGFWLKGAEAAQAAEGGWITAKEKQVSALVADLSRRLRPGDQVQVLDTTEGGVHALLRLRIVQPTRFLYDFPFYSHVDDPVIRGLRAEFIAGLGAHPPRYIVLFRRGWPAGGYERLAAFPELRRLLLDGYRPVQERDGYRLYAKRDDS